MAYRVNRESFSHSVSWTHRRLIPQRLTCSTEPMPPALPHDRLRLGHVLAETGRIFRRDFLVLIAVAVLVRGAGVAAEVWLGAMVPKVGPTALVIPWLGGFIPFALADGAIVWLVLRRLGGGGGPATGGALGLLRLAGVILAVDLVENVPDVIQICLPKAFFVSLKGFGEAILPIVDAFWLALWLPALAVAVAEGAGGPTSLGRSLDLTYGQRWSLAALCIGAQLAIDMSQLLAVYGMGLTGAQSTPAWVAELASLPIWTFFSATQAVIYWELVRLKTGLSPTAAGGVFD